MKKTHFSHKVMAIFLTLIFLPSVLPVNYLYASNNGPNAPEAASFEPVDATDMVNLVTGDMSYVMPLLNVPSPEGGYPLALSYHAGIAMDQEASWVGLGWNLNPGAINRSVNGFPDDWGKTVYNELIYDEGGADDYYSFSIGGTLPNGITLGVSKSWGANRAWGGTVGYAGVTTNFGSKGIKVGLGLNAGPLSLNLSEEGYGVSASLGSASVGYNSSSNKINVSYTASLKSSSTGVSVSSQNGISSSIAGFSSSKQTLSSSANSDYYTNTISKGFGIDIGFFWAKYQHTRFEYSLFKNTRYLVNGSLNPYQVLDVDDDFRQQRNTLMDVKEYHVSSRSNVYSSDVTGKNKSTFIFPNYDNYAIHAQGLSANMSPKYFEEVNLFNKGKYEKNVPDSAYYSTEEVFVNFLVDPSVDYSQYKLGKKLHFYLNNTNSSFLRTTTGAFAGPNITDSSDNSTDVDIVNNQTALLQYNTTNDPTFESTTTSDGHLKRNGSRKRDGTFVESFTNEEIISGAVGYDFIEAKELNRNDFDELPDGIGAFRITTLDGKTYHYSLPVLHYESFDKNFESIATEDKKFFESKKLKPYATHWLLTAVTGPDYMDANLDGKLDEGDYGYWVELEYGKWSDGYAWRTPKSGYKAVTHPYYVDADTGNDKIEGYKFFWGRKQVYYLDKVKTRTHTALFIKSLREDNQSTEVNEYVKYFNGQSDFDPETYSKIFKDKEEIYFANYEGSLYKNYNGPFYDTQGNEIMIPQYSYKGRKVNEKYAYAPVNRTLKLDKIILLKNDKDITDKSTGNIISNTTGNFSFREAYFNVKNLYNLVEIPNLYFSSDPLSSFNGHLHQNVLDVNDIALNSHVLKNNAEKIIYFNYDYSLARYTPNSSASLGGRLTLNSVNTAGKKGVSLIPPHKFNYAKQSTAYGFENQDAWGYINEHPEAWSLHEITSPTGSTINIDYEADSFYTEAAYRKSDNHIKFEILRDIPGPEGWTNDEIGETYANNITNVQKNGDEITVSFDSSQVSNSLSDIFLIGSEIDVSYVHKADSYRKYNGYDFNHNTYEIIEINQSNNSLKLKVNESTNLDKHEFMANMNCNSVGENPLGSNICIVLFTFYYSNGLNTDEDLNGETGGGLRVASVSVSDGGKSYKTEYDYMHPKNNRISGITSYAPSENRKYVPYIEELPAPNVMYEYVKVTNLDSDLQPIQKTLYQHEVLKPDNLNLQEQSQYTLGNSFKVTKEQSIGSLGSKDKVYKYTMYDNLSILGRLKTVKVFNSLDHQVSATVNRYKGFSNGDQSQGVVQETFKAYSRYEVRRDSPSNGFTTNIYYNLNSSSKVEFPSVLKSVTNTQGGISQTTRFTKHDFLTGSVLETEIENNGTKYKIEITPAYENLTSMGPKSDLNTKANMLTQVAMKKDYVWRNSDWATIGASINKWGIFPYYFNEGNRGKTYYINRKEKNYVWDGSTDANGIFTNFSGKDDNFDWNPLIEEQPTGSNWKLVSKINKYDPYSMALEMEDVNKNKASTKMGDDNTKIFATGNAGYYEMYYSGAEDEISGSYGGEVLKGTATNSSEAHTGTNALQIAPNQWAFKVNIAYDIDKLPENATTKPFKASVWVKEGQENDVQLNVAARKGELVHAGDWVQVNFYADIANNTEVHLNTTGNILIADDFRIHPVSSSMTAYVYNKWDELTHIIGGNNMAVEYQYDSMGRLKKTLTEVAKYGDAVSEKGGFKKISKNKYTYKY